MPSTDCGIFSLPGHDLYASRAWLDVAVAEAMPPGDTAHLVACASPRGTAALVPLRRSARGRLSALTTPYTAAWTPLLAPGWTDVEAVGRACGEAMRPCPVTRLDCVPEEWPGLAAFCAGLRGSGLAVVRFAHFGNWHQPVAGLGWDAYLAGRPGALRTTLRRKLRHGEALGLRIVTEPADAERAIAAYAWVYARSWKEPEPFPGFIPALIRSTAASGTLRLGLLGDPDHPAAAQLWVVAGGCASVLKLAHDTEQAALSPGTVLTARMIRALLAEGVGELDFGRGDDPYKRLWAGSRRQRIGLVAADPWHPAGAAFLAAHAAGLAARRAAGLLRRVRTRLRPAALPRAVA